MSSFSCDCSACVDIGPDVGTVKIRKARKQHECCECGEMIQPGEKYEYVTGLNDGDWWSYDTCMTCKTIRDRYCPSGYYYGELAEAILECLYFDYREVPEDDEDV